ncbi:MAG: class I SAM-dependent methyltransferase [Candidatus Doudnabacteria bacterium]|nr:class I SAM-dependent methyltransferase [Candidatus Doudnabacteria bacterium]
MILETFKNFSDFELLDSGLGYRLERWCAATLQRPDPQIIWQCSLPVEEWNKAWAIFESPSGSEKGRWEIKQALPHPWIVKFGEVQFQLKLSPFKHTGLFAEQAANWEWMLAKISNGKFQIPSDGSSASNSSSADGNNRVLKILNLFAYTGGTTMVLAKAGCQVTHVDASKPAITWANENHKLNNLPADSVRWILDDAVKFVKRELKRGAKYDGIIMDPPAFGHSPTGKTWKFNDDLPGLLSDCVELLSDDAKFLVVNGYATNSSALALNNLLEDSISSKHGKIEFGELCLKQKSGRLLSTGIFSRWSK